MAILEIAHQRCGFAEQDYLRALIQPIQGTCLPQTGCVITLKRQDVFGSVVEPHLTCKHLMSAGYVMEDVWNWWKPTIALSGSTDYLP